MIPEVSPGQSLKTRITLATLLIFVASLWSLTYYSSQMLRHDMERQLGEQQLSTLTLLAAQLDRELTSRLLAIETVAARAAPAMQNGPAAVQRFVEQHPTLLSLFNRGLIALDREGRVIADVPLATGRTGVDLGDREAIAAALNAGRATIGPLVLGKKLAAPIFHVAAPILDDQGRVIGALAGVTHLGLPNFLDQATQINYGKSGGYLLIAPQHRLLVSATDKHRIMETLPAAGVNPGLDRIIGDADDYGVFVDPQGVELLASHKTIPVTGWRVAATLPTAEAFAPIRDMQQRMLGATLLLTLLAGSLTGWMLKRQFSPLRAAIRTLAAMSRTQQPLSALPVFRHDEIGQLIGGFNQLLETLKKREEALSESETLQQTLLANILVGVIIVDPVTRTIESVNDAAAAMFGTSAQHIVGRRCHAFLCPNAECACPILDLGRPVDNMEKEMLCADGRRRTVLKSVTRITLHGREKLLECFVDIDERKRAEDEIKQLAFYDPLTRLPNRRLLLDRLEQALAACCRHQREGALLYIDLDDFKTLNDTRGHNVGDLLLKQVADLLVACVREGDTVARFGGDEFVVMLEDLSDNPQDAATQARIVGNKILGIFERRFDLAGYDHHCTASIGITLFADHQETIEDLLKQADLSMYQSKAGGRNALRFFNQEMQATITQRAALEADFSEAIAGQQFMLYYQAQVSGEHALFGAEALVRWQHPRRGLVPPAEFIPLAEETGLILPLGNWVLNTACRQLAAWAAEPQTAQLTLAVNVSVRQFHQADFVDQVICALDRSGANPQRLKLELTETLLVSNIEDIIAKMTILKAHGVGFSLDDFGTGYSSLSYLKRLPLDQLKIDQGFVRDILIDANDAAIAKMVIALAGSLGLKVIAEGVENEAQRIFLARHACHDFQGYLFSRPLPPHEFEEFARAHWIAPKRLLPAAPQRSALAVEACG